MIILDFFDYFFLILGAFISWIGIYILAKNPHFHKSWAVFFLFSVCGVVIGLDPVYQNVTNQHDYAFWQNILNIPLYFAGPLVYLLSLNKLNIWSRIAFATALLFSIFVAIADLRGGLVVEESVIINSGYELFMKPGILLIPAIIVSVLCFFGAIANFLRDAAKNRLYYLSIIGIFIYVIIAYSFYAVHFLDFFISSITFDLFVLFSTLLVGLPLISKSLFVDTEKWHMDRTFLIRSIAILFIFLIYLALFLIFRFSLDFKLFVFLSVLIFAVLLTHSSYDWISTFTRDIFQNYPSGLSITTDNEVYDSLKNYNKLDLLADSPLLNLRIVKNSDNYPVDSLRRVLREAIEYFRTNDHKNRRIKRNLKYQILRMMTFDDAEEGQILWELGFEEYPSSILKLEQKNRPPIYQNFAPSDYTYTSRNAFLALRREAIHDVTWRLSYLEKMTRK